MAKRILALMCAALLMLSLLSCKKDREEEPDGESVETEQPAAEESEQTEEETVDSDVDPNGYDTPIDRF